MNKFEVKMITGDFDPFLQFFVDGIELDKILDTKCPENYILDTCPTLSFDLEMDDEKRVVWERILPKDGHSFCPVLMCPDDRDFWCYILLVEIEVDNDVVSWKRFGLNKSKPDPPEKVGDTIKWLNNSPSFNFNKEEYIHGLRKFQDKFKEDRINSLDGNLTFPEYAKFVPNEFQSMEIRSTY